MRGNGHFHISGVPLFHRFRVPSDGSHLLGPSSWVLSGGGVNADADCRLRGMGTLKTATDGQLCRKCGAEVSPEGHPLYMVAGGRGEP